VVPNIKHAIMWSYEVWSELDAQIIMTCWRMARVLPTTWNVNFALVDEREKNRMQRESYDFGALISKLRLGDDEMSIETYIQMEGEDIIELEFVLMSWWMLLWESIMHEALILMLVYIH
jgi:hypothetical protein